MEILKNFPTFSTPSFNSMSSFYRKSFLHIAVGIGLGLLIENVCKKIQLNYKLSPLTMVIMQLFMIVTILYIVQSYISHSFAIDWQRITPGFIFVSLFFNLQTTLINNINSAFTSLKL